MLPHCSKQGAWNLKYTPQFWAHTPPNSPTNQKMPGNIGSSSSCIFRFHMQHRRCMPETTATYRSWFRSNQLHTYCSKFLPNVARWVVPTRDCHMRVPLETHCHNQLHWTMQLRNKCTGSCPNHLCNGCFHPSSTSLALYIFCKTNTRPIWNNIVLSFRLSTTHNFSH